MHMQNASHFIGHVIKSVVHTSAVLCALMVIYIGATHEAKAELRICNTTTSRIGVSLGYRDPQGWVTEGWWNIAPKACETMLKGTLAARYYYLHAVDYDKGGEWGGKDFLCTRDREFTIRGADNCFSRGFDRVGFFEVDTGEQPGWTVQLTGPRAERAPSMPLTTTLPRQ